MLTNAKVTGKYKYKDVFQLLPAPNHFPHAPCTEAHHPCLLEIKYDFTPDSSKRMDDQTEFPEWLQRRNHEEKLIHEITSLFGIFSLSKFITIQNSHSWTIPTTDDFAIESEWRQLSYCVKEHQQRISEFTHFKAPQINEINTTDLYKFGLKFLGSNFSIPDLFGKILDAYYNLDQNEKNAILRSATLFNNAIRIKPISRSISFACFVSSIESLIDHTHKEIKIEKCRECNAPRYAVTKKFTEFLEKYSSDTAELIKFYKKVYGKRSEILHAGALFQGEHIPKDWDESDWEAHHMNFGIERICRIAITNWILESDMHPRTA